MEYLLTIFLSWLIVMLVCAFGVGYNIGRIITLRVETKTILKLWKKTIDDWHESNERQSNIIEDLRLELKLCKNLVQLPDERTTIED